MFSEVTHTIPQNPKHRGDYYPLGLQIPDRVFASGSLTREGFTGHELDTETGDYYAGARYYLPELGRFSSTDPAGQYASPYLYWGNNPASFLDPDGRFAVPPDDYIFENGRYTGRKVERKGPHRVVNIDTATDERTVYNLNDSSRDALAIDNGVVHKLRFISSETIDGVMDATVPSGLGHAVALSYAKGMAEGIMDYGPEGAANGTFKKDAIHIPEGSQTGYLLDDIGNFFFGQGGNRLGLTLVEVLSGAHYNNATSGRDQMTDLYDFGPGTYGDPGFFDSDADQTALIRGYVHFIQPLIDPNRRYVGGFK